MLFKAFQFNTLTINENVLYYLIVYTLSYLFRLKQAILRENQAWRGSNIQI